ncbi:MAG: potassium channel family protein [Bacteroidales bacterium]|nr:potassium channel family protein [Bacteroidales bacterium]
MNARIEKFREELNRVFDDDLHTKQWHNYVDYAIIGLIVISTIEVFLSTYDGIVERYGKWLHFVDYFTTIFFTIEVSLRIWCADLLDEKYKGFWGRVRYCFSFYGLIDILSTYPFYLSFFMKVPYAALKALRIARLLRIFRYMKAFNILSRAIKAKKQEMIVSLQFLTIVTLILSFVLFFVEHAAQPEVYDNGWTSVVWAFAQYIGDPGGFADTPPITFTGRIIACIIGVLGIAIFAVPAGLIGSAFTEVMDADKEDEHIKNNIERIRHSFKFEKDQQHTNLFHVPRYQPVDTILTRKFIPQIDIIKAVEASDCFHLYNLASSLNRNDKPEDKIVVINYLKNTPYGCCIDRGSKVTIVFTSGPTEPMTGWFAYHIAKLGGFNYVSKEIEVDADNPVTYYNIEDEAACPNMRLFLDDINRLTSRPGSWAIPVLGAVGLMSRPTKIHFCYNTVKHDAGYDDPDARIADYQTFDSLYLKVADVMDVRYDLKCDRNEWYAVQKEKNIAYHINAENVFTLRVEAYLFTFDNRYLEIVKTLADAFNGALEPEIRKELPCEMLNRRIGYDFGFSDYIN